jgi:hypothetical protein
MNLPSLGTPNQLPESEQLTYCRNELEVLKGVIDYAERMIAEDGGRSPYQSLRRHAYGKTVVIKTAREGTLVFRLSATSLTYPNFASGYATPHSPVGRLCSVLRPGEIGSSPKWGNYRVFETRLFDRFDGMEFDVNVRNFLHMVVAGESGNATVSDLQRTLWEGSTKPKAPAAPQILPIAPLVAAAPSQPTVPAPSLPAHPSLQLAHLEVADEEETIESLATEIDDTDDLAITDRSSTDEYFGLAEVFYLNRTREQDQVIGRSPVGAMFVEGVAGSGKTSAALGRTKMLCDFKESSVTEETAFREIADESMAHWSGKFAGRFSQEGSIGFVRTGELIQYLKETCRRIDLPNLPVAEYKELQVRLRQHRKVERSGKPGWHWSMLPAPRASEMDTTMVWLRAADRAVSRLISQRLATALPATETVTRLFVTKQRPIVAKVVEVALATTQESLKPIQAVMRQNPAVGRFGLDKLAENLARIVRDLRIKLLSKDVLWVLDGEQALYGANEHVLAALLVRRKVPLYLRNTARNTVRLVMLDDQGPADPSLTFHTPEGDLLTWSEEVRTTLAAGNVVVKDASGQAFLAVASNAQDLSLKLLPEAIERLFVLRGGKLWPAVHRGLGRVKFELLKPQIKEANEDDEVGAGDEAVDPAVPVGDPKFTTIDAVLRRQLQKALLQPLAYLADIYMDSLGSMADDFPEPVLAWEIHAQMQDKKLADEDIDLLLCLAHLAGRAFDGNPAQLKAPRYYQSVFIDEVQDFTEQQVFLMAEQAKPDYKAVTVVGDIAQKLHHGSHIDIRACFPGNEIAHVSLTENLRQLDAPRLAWFSACFRSEFQDGLADAAPSGVLLQRLTDKVQNLKGPELTYYADVAEMDALIVELLRKMPVGQTAAVILPNGNLAAESHVRLRPALASAFVETELSDKVDLSRRHMRHFISVVNAKGLEFDVVVLPFLEVYDLEDLSHINRLYVGLTRARKRLVLLADRAMKSARFDALWVRYENAFSGVTEMPADRHDFTLVSEDGRFRGSLEDVGACSQP